MYMSYKKYIMLSKNFTILTNSFCLGIGYARIIWIEVATARLVQEKGKFQCFNMSCTLNDPLF